MNETGRKETAKTQEWRNRHSKTCPFFPTWMHANWWFFTRRQSDFWFTLTELYKAFWSTSWIQLGNVGGYASRNLAHDDKIQVALFQEFEIRMKKSWQIRLENGHWFRDQDTHPFFHGWQKVISQRSSPSIPLCYNSHKLTYYYVSSSDIV